MASIGTFLKCSGELRRHSKCKSFWLSQRNMFCFQTFVYFALCSYPIKLGVYILINGFLKSENSAEEIFSNDDTVTFVNCGMKFWESKVENFGSEGSRRRLKLERGNPKHMGTGVYERIYDLQSYIRGGDLVLWECEV